MKAVGVSQEYDVDSHLLLAVKSLQSAKKFVSVSAALRTPTRVCVAAAPFYKSVKNR